MLNYYNKYDELPADNGLVGAMPTEVGLLTALTVIRFGK
jgi:hypothetical protein